LEEELSMFLFSLSIMESSKSKLLQETLISEEKILTTNLLSTVSMTS